MVGEGVDPTGGSLAICIVLFIAITSKEFLSMIPNLKIPFTLFMLLAGLCMEIFVALGTCEASSEYVGNETICVDLDVRSKCEAVPECNFKATFYGQSGKVDMVYYSMDVWTSMDPHLIMYTFLPALIYASSSSLSFHVFMKSLSTIAVLAGPGVLIATMLTALLVHTFQPDEYDWTWTSAIGFGAMISATDPVAVVALLKEMNAPTNLGVIIEGESLFNDGTAFAFFLICFEGLKGTERTLSESVGFFAQLAFGGLALGYCSGFIMIRFLKHTNEGLIEVVSTLVFAYGTFIIAEEIHVSGVLAVVALGLQMSQNGKPHLADEQIMHHFWELMEFIANVVIFAICGFHIAHAFLSTTDIRDGLGSAAQNLGFTLAIFMFTLIVRVVNLALLTPVLRFAGYGVQFGEQVVMAWAGLRGAVSLTLAAMIAQTKLSNFDCDVALEGGCTPENETTRLELFTSRMLYHCAGVTFLTLVVNGTTTGSLLKYFKIGIQCVASKHAFDRIVRDLSNETEKQLEFLKDTHPFFEHCNLDLIYDLLPVFNEEMLEERLQSGKVSAARYKMIDESPFFRSMRRHYEDHSLNQGNALQKGKSKKMNQKKRTTVVGGEMHLVHHALLRHTSSGNFENPQDTAETLLADPHALAEFAQAKWGEIVETRRRALLMLSASYWNNFERGFTTSNVIGILMDAADTAMDRQRRAPKDAPSIEDWNKYTVSSWEVLESSMRMGYLKKILIWILKKLPFETTHKWARYIFHHSFERTIDIANSFAIGYHSLESRLHKMAKTSTRVRCDPTLCHIHSLDPVVLEIVAAEVKASSEAAKDLVRSAVQANNELLKSVASKQAVRYLLKGIVKAVEHEHEIGEIDSTEKSMLETCTKFCMLRLNRGAMLAPPPSIDSFLRRIPFLKDLDNDVLHAIADVSKERHIVAGSMLFKQKRTRAHGLHLVLGGRVAVFARRSTGHTPVQKKRKKSAKKGRSRWSITNGTRWSITDIAKAVIAGAKSNNSTSSKEEVEEEKMEEKEGEQKEKKGAPLTSRWSITDMIQNVRKKSTRQSQSGNDINEDLGKCAMVLEKGNEILGTLSLMTGNFHYMSAQAQSMVLSLYIPSWCVNKIFTILEDLSIGPDDYFLNASSHNRRKSGKTPSKQVSNVMGFGSNSDDSDDDMKKDEENEQQTEELPGLPQYPTERTSRINFDSSTSFEIPEMDAVVFCEGIAKNACLQACLTVLEYDVVSTFKLRALDLQAQMTKMCERAEYMKVRANETVYLPRPAVLITGHLERVYDNDSPDKPTKYSGISFIPNSNPNGDREFNEFVYKATNQRCEDDDLERHVQLVMFHEDDVIDLSIASKMRRRLVKSFSSTFLKDGDKKKNNKVTPSSPSDDEEKKVDASHHYRRKGAKRKHSLFGRIFASQVFQHGNQHGPQTHR